MADGSIGGNDPRKTEPAAASPPLPVAQKGPKAMEPGATAASVHTGKAEEARAKEPLRELVDKLGRTQELVARVDPALAATIRGITDAVNAPGRVEEPMFRTRVAYALQDTERLVGPMVNLPQGVREEMTRLAATSPGLQNERMQDVVRGTAAMDDRGLVRDIRKYAAEVARAGDQTSPDVQSKVEVLENRVRLGVRGEATVGTEVKSGLTSEIQATVNETVSKTIGQTEPLRKVADQTIEMPSKQGIDATQNAAIQQRSPPDQIQQRGIGATFAIMSALRKPEPTTPAPWDQQLTPLKDRVARYVERAEANEQEASLRAAEKSGQAAVQALRAFANGAGASIMDKIQAAGKADPDGAAGVAAGMREGGPYADLRRTFNADLVKEKGLAAALDHASAAVSKYGVDRTAVDGVAAGRADAATITARFAKLDAEVGKAASETPSRKDGKSQMEELGEKAAELASKAIEAVRSAFKRNPSAEQRPSAGPSP